MHVKRFQLLGSLVRCVSPWTFARDRPNITSHTTFFPINPRQHTQPTQSLKSLFDLDSVMPPPLAAVRDKRLGEALSNTMDLSRQYSPY